MAGSGGDFMRGSFMNKTTSVIVVIGGERLIVLFTAGTVHFPRLLRKIPEVDSIRGILDDDGGGRVRLAIEMALWKW